MIHVNQAYVRRRRRSAILVTRNERGRQVRRPRQIASRLRARSARPAKLRTPMHVIPGDVVDAGKPDIVRQFERRRHWRGFVALVRETVEDASACRPEPAHAAVTVMMVMIHRSAGHLREGRTLRSSACAAPGARIGKGLAPGKEKRDGTEGRDQHRSMGHGTHPFLRLPGSISSDAMPGHSCPQRHN